MGNKSQERSGKQRKNRLEHQKEQSHDERQQQKLIARKERQANWRTKDD